MVIIEIIVIKAIIIVIVKVKIIVIIQIIILKYSVPREQRKTIRYNVNSYLHPYTIIYIFTYFIYSFCELTKVTTPVLSHLLNIQM